ncbi:MAG TPA: ChaN family lipoprotein [Fimbriimonadaceae bacterium]|nr:ChaN family lipoprotein [Fimbriimonadaceae bacterium]
MLSAFVGALAIAQKDAVDPYLLPIPSESQVRIEMGLNDLARGRRASVQEVVEAARAARYLLVGESHDSGEHHKMQGEIIRALVESGRRVTVGFEMFTRPNQMNLNPYTLGRWSEAEFIERSNWKKEWGFEFGLYKPIFDVVREFGLPMVALNVPRDWVRSVGRSGPTGLTAEQQRELPELFLGNTTHRQVFTAMMGGHPMAGPQMDNTYAAMVLWDEGMADTAIKYVQARPANPNAIFVIIAGSGHVMYDQGINYRIQRRTGDKTVSVVCIDGNEGRMVSRGLADYVFLSPPPVRAPQNPR